MADGAERLVRNARGLARAALADIAAAALTLVFGIACAAFVWQPTLASFADDSVSYLVMAQVFSPYQAASPAVTAAFAREAFYPPLFPGLLALAGAAHDIAWAHGFTALLLAAALPVLYALGVRWLESRWVAAFAVLCTALLPALWVNAKGILSEPLFCALLLALLLAMERDESRRRTALLAVLLAALALTRTAGLAVAGFYALWALTRRVQPLRSRFLSLVPAIAAGAAYAAWIAVRPAETADDNMRIVLERAGAFLGGEQPWAAMGESLARQARAVAEAWVGGLVVYWIEGRPVRLALCGLVGALSLVGLVLRLRAGKPDAWLMAGYLALYLVWPFYDQMGRFLFPVLPVLVLYAFLASGAAAKTLGRRPALTQAAIGLLMLSLAVPAMAFIHQRAIARGPYVQITDWYRVPGLSEARARSEIHLGLLADMAAIRALTRHEHRVMWVVPSYVALLADRRAVRAPAAELAPEDYLRAVRAAQPDYVFLSFYHPRDTLETRAWRTGMRALDGQGEIVHAYTIPGGTVVSSVLIKVRR